MPLVERTAQVAALEAALARATSGQGAIVVLEGVAGAGRTRLLREVAARARATGLRVLDARGAELEQGFRLGVVRQLFEPVLLAPGAEGRQLLRGVAALARPALEGPAAPGPEADGAAFRALLWLVASLAERRPLLLGIDDAQWADTASLRWLLFLAHRVADLPGTVLVATRPHGPPDAQELLSRLAGGTGARVLALPRLSPTAIAEVARHRLGRTPDAPLVAALDRATAGSPRLLDEALQALSAHPGAAEAAMVAELAPPAVATAALLIARELGPAGAAVCRAVAVLDGEGDRRAVAELSGLTADESARVVDALVARGLLAPGPLPAFAAAMVREAVHAHQPAAARARAHAHAARVLAARGVAAARIAADLHQADPDADPWAVDVLRQTARDALAAGDPAAAARHLRRALREPPEPSVRDGVVLELGQAEATAGEEGAVIHLRVAVGGVDRDAAARAGIVLGRALLARGHDGEAVAAYDEACRVSARLDAELWLQAESERFAAAMSCPGLARDALERLRAVAVRAGDRGDRHGPGGGVLLATVAVARAVDGEPAEHVGPAAERALGRAGLLAEQTCESPAYYAACRALTWCDRPSAGVRHATAALEDARRRGSRHGRLWAWVARGDALLRMGALAEASIDAAAAVELSGPAAAGLRLLGVGLLALALLDRGETAAARERLAELPAEPSGTDLPSGAWAPAVFARGRLQLAGGAHDAALASFDRCGRDLLGPIAANPSALPWRSAGAAALDALGRRDEAVARADEELALAQRFGAPRAVGVALSGRASVEQGPARVELLREAVAVLVRSPAALEHARALAALGAALRRAGHAADARAPLREALDLAGRCGAGGLADEVLEELLAAGARPRRRSIHGRDALTPSELRVARLVAEGRTNREVARELVVTVNTVESHLGRVFRKLGVRSRRELAEALARRGDLSG